MAVAGLAALAIVAGGCWDHSPIEETAFVMMLGVDLDPADPDQWVVTQMIALPAHLSAQASGSGVGPSSGTPFYLISSRAASLQLALSAIGRQVPRQTRLDHMRVIVVGEEVARSGAGPVFAWALRHPQVRPGTVVVVSEGPAQQFMDSQPVLDPLPGSAVIGIIRHVQRIDVAYQAHVYQLVQWVLSPRRDAAAPLVRRINPLTARVPAGFEQQPAAGQPPSAPGETLPNEIEIIGMAVFNGDRLVGAVQGPDARGVSWIRGGSQGFISVPYPADPDRTVTVSILHTRSSLDAEPGDDSLRLVIRVEGEGSIYEAGALTPLSDDPYWPQLEQAVADAIAQEIRRTVSRLQQLRADIFGFAEHLYRRSPDAWRRVADRWDDLYAQAEVEVDVRMRLSRTGLAR